VFSDNDSIPAGTLEGQEKMPLAPDPGPRSRFSLFPAAFFPDQMQPVDKGAGKTTLNDSKTRVIADFETFKERPEIVQCAGPLADWRPNLPMAKRLVKNS